MVLADVHELRRNLIPMNLIWPPSVQIPSYFANRIILIKGNESVQLRVTYVNRFVDTQSEWYKMKIERTLEFGGREYYHGILWETIPHPKVLSPNDAASIASRNHVVYAMWDLKKPILAAFEDLMKPYWEIPDNAILRTTYGDLADNLESLPPDVYIFDDSFNWTVIFTHETDQSGEQLCLAVLNSYARHHITDDSNHNRGCHD
jgi:hypothetical protein